MRGTSQIVLWFFLFLIPFNLCFNGIMLTYYLHQEETPTTLAGNHSLVVSTSTSVYPQTNQISFNSIKMISMAGREIQKEAPTGTGVFVLGMHRSGTSLLTGLLVEGMGYNPGGPLIEPRKFNEKGYYELVPLVTQDLKWLDQQQVDYIRSPHQFDITKTAAADHPLQEDGLEALFFLNRNIPIPYIVKAPTLCLTLPLWISFLSTKPAVVLTFRDPMDVAYSLERRERQPLRHGFRAWITYNQRAVQHTQGLCVVTTSHKHILQDPIQEVTRLSSELTQKCGVAPPLRRTLSAAVAHEFVSEKLQHPTPRHNETDILETYTPQCTIRHHPRILAAHVSLWVRVRRIYCDLESGRAHAPDYDWHASLTEQAA